MDERRTILVTGGAGFIGSAVCRHLIAGGETRVVNVDNLTYAGNPASLAEIEGASNYRFVLADIANDAIIGKLLREERVSAIMHLAAETHVDRSIDGPEAFIQSNMVGTYRLLQTALSYWRGLGGKEQESFRFHHVSTDEVFGDLPLNEGVFTEESPYRPSSPYSASKAGSDHLVRAWHHTFGLPVILSNCSNNYGPYHFPEKLIPLVILNALDEADLPVYGTGSNVRDWLYVEDHARALELVVNRGRVGDTYLIGGRAERTNLAVVQEICRILDARKPRARGGSYLDLISFVEDRPGHDRRYAIDPGKVETELGWQAQESFESGLAKTVEWYLRRKDWWAPLRQAYAGQRLGAKAETTR